MEKHGIKFWAEDDKPREKLLLKGKTALSDADLLAILIGSGTWKKCAVTLAQEILSEFQNNLTLFSKAQISELLAVIEIAQPGTIGV